EYHDLPRWDEDDPRALFAGMRRCLDHVTSVKPYRAGSLGLTCEDILPAYREAPENAANPAAARDFFEKHFQPFLIRRSDGKRGFITAFYEPEVEVSPTPSATWAYPFYRRPEDLVDLDDDNRPPELDASYMFGRLE